MGLRNKYNIFLYESELQVQIFGFYIENVSKIKRFQPVLRGTDLILKFHSTQGFPKSGDTFRFQAEIFLKLLDVTVRQVGHPFNNNQYRIRLRVNAKKTCTSL